MGRYQSLQGEVLAHASPYYAATQDDGSRSILLHQVQVGNEREDVVIRVVSSLDQMRSACDLLNDRYAWRGYGDHHKIPADQHHITFTAEIAGDVVGTITLALDSEKGMAADRSYKTEIDEYRAMPGSGACELTKFAFDPAVQSKELMAALFHTVFVYGSRTYGCSDLFVEVVARHVRFYEAMLGFQTVGEMKPNQTVHKPVQLMWLKVSDIRDNINRLASAPKMVGARSLYPFFFSPAKEDGIYSALTREPVRSINLPVQGLGSEALPWVSSCDVDGAYARGIPNQIGHGGVQLHG